MVLFLTRITGALIGLALLFIFLLILFLALHLSSAKKTWKLISFREKILSLLFSLAYIVVIFNLISREKFIYYWDYGSYWVSSLYFLNILVNTPLEALRLLYISINTNEYNLLISSFTAVPIKLFGSSYLSYVLVNTCLFICPCVFVLSLLLKELISILKVKMIGFHWIILFVLSFSMFTLPTLYGYADACGLLVITVCLYLTFHTDWSKFSYKNDILISILLLMLMILRRYFAYWVVGYVVALITYGLYKLWIEEDKKRFFKRFSQNIIFIGLISSTLLLSVFNGFFRKSFFNNYKDAYAGYDSSNLAYKYLQLFAYLGIILTILLIIGLVYVFLKKSEKSVITFMIINIIVSTLSFYQVQDMGIHHYYIIAVPLCILIFTGIISLYNMLTKYKVKIRVSVLFITIGLIFINSVYGFTAIKIFNISPPITTYAYYSPRVRSDMEQIYSLRSQLKDITPKSESIYVLASSGVLNADIIAKSSLPSFDTGLNIANVSQVDLRDGFSTNFFDSDCVVVCTPIQCHLDPSDQEVIRTLAKETLDSSSPIGKHFTKVSEYTLDDGVKAIVLKKCDTFTSPDITYLQNIYNNIYPDYPELFNDKFEDYIENSKL